MDRPTTPEPHTRWRLDEAGWSLLCPDGHAVALTRTERRVLARLLLTPGQLVTREDLVVSLTDGEFDSHRLDSLVYRLRRKVADGCELPLPLDAIHGEGYVFDDTR
ncbi:MULTISPECIES: helix-turn-helix domain-containing protein [unclassified Lysobacter]|uniref:winged helix-turn-helix domain-containing protein n=1 Tax=unclassified Lysobacter TaxID=2635362 RepID=UPI001C21F754|nr:helix-turn-helix domain-containing protein [Lysobacter sp. MMG2]MBU8976624.1 helix-turn-helix domain-containing protein [Lysobacter sp. MMG2]